MTNLSRIITEENFHGDYTFTYYDTGALVFKKTEDNMENIILRVSRTDILPRNLVATLEKRLLEWVPAKMYELNFSPVYSGPHLTGFCTTEADDPALRFATLLGLCRNGRDITFDEYYRFLETKREMLPKADKAGVLEKLIFKDLFFCTYSISHKMIRVNSYKELVKATEIQEQHINKFFFETRFEDILQNIDDYPETFPRTLTVKEREKFVQALRGTFSSMYAYIRNGTKENGIIIEAYLRVSEARFAELLSFLKNSQEDAMRYSDGYSNNSLKYIENHYALDKERFMNAIVDEDLILIMAAYAH